MRRFIFVGAVSAVLFAVGCGPQSPEDPADQVQGMKATPILFNISCPEPTACSADFGKCTEWSPASSCGDSGSAYQYRTCYDASGNACTNVAVSAQAAQ
jgi:hypothetical protein